MDEPLEIEKILNDIDFSRGHEHAVWEKIMSRLPNGTGALPFCKLDTVASGSLDIVEHCDNWDDLLKVINKGHL